MGCPVRDGFDYRIGRALGRFDWRVKYRFGFAHFGIWRYLRIGKLAVRLWEVR